MIALSIDRQAAYREADKTTRLVLRGALDAVRQETRGLEQDLEKITRLAVPGRLWRGWRSDTFRPLSREPTGWVKFSTGPRSQGALAFWTQPGRIARGAGKYLAVPTAAAKRYETGPNLGTKNAPKLSNGPKLFEAKYSVELRFIPPKKIGGNAVLILDNARVKKSGKAIPRKANSRSQSQSVVLFVLIPFVDHKNAFAIEPVIARRRQTLPQTLDRAIKARLDS
jgi:hypothetical protein